MVKMSFRDFIAGFLLGVVGTILVGGLVVYIANQPKAQDGQPGPRPPMTTSDPKFITPPGTPFLVTRPVGTVQLQQDDLSELKRDVVAAMRRGNRAEAARLILNN